MSAIQEKDLSAIRNEDAGTKTLGSAPLNDNKQGTKYVGCFQSSFTGPAAEVRELPKCVVRNIQLRSGRGTIGQATFQPGWKWSTDLKPIVKTDLCQQSHLGIILKGKMTCQMKDGTTLEGKAGDAFFIPPGHDGWVSSDEECVVIDATGFQTYGIQQSKDAEKAAPATHCCGEHEKDLKNTPMMVKSFDKADEVKDLPNCRLELVKFGEVAAIGRLTVQPGWKWSTHIKPLVGTDYCEHSHMGIAVGGQHAIFMRDSKHTETMDARNEVHMCEVEPGHDGWIVGNDVGVMYDITPMIKQYGDHKH
jgi:uncharacterized protein YjlB